MEDSVFEQILIESLEQFAFLFADLIEDDAFVPEWSEPCWVGHLHFRSEARSGRLQVAMPLSLCLEMTVNVMGLGGEEDAAEALVSDALKEFVNIVAGSFTAAAFGTGAVFTLDPPEAVLHDVDSVVALFQQGNHCTYLQVDDYLVAGCYGLE